MGAWGAPAEVHPVVNRGFGFKPFFQEHELFVLKGGAKGSIVRSQAAVTATGWAWGQLCCHSHCPAGSLCYLGFNPGPCWLLDHGTLCCVACTCCQVFAAAGLQSPIVASIITGGVNLLFTIAAASAIDRCASDRRVVHCLFCIAGPQQCCQDRMFLLHVGAQ